MAVKKKPRGKPFAAGDRRINRKGRPRTGETMAETLRAMLATVKGGLSRREIIAEAQMVKAEKGDTVAARLVIERAEGHALMPLSMIDGTAELMRVKETDPRKLATMRGNMRLLLAEKAKSDGKN